MQLNINKLIMPALLLISFNLIAAGDKERGQVLAATCAACHGMDGNSVNPIWPNLAGQHDFCLERQITLFRDGERENELMSPVVADLSDQDIADLAAYFSSQKLAAKAATPESVELGRKIYQGGDMSRNIPACMSCHGPTAQGNPLTGYPILANQHAAYTVKQLQEYKAGKTVPDKGDVKGQIMADVARYMTEEEIEAVASYVQGIRAAQ